MSQEILKYKIGLSLLPKIGNVTAKKLIAYTGSIEAVFREKRRNLKKIPGIGSALAEYIVKQNVLDIAESEINLMERNQVEAKFYLDREYPERLRHCNDAPVILYQKGDCDLNKNKVLSFVGTRNATPYGKQMCEKLIGDLRSRGHEVLIVSGLAYGIDICSHRGAMKNELETVAVLGHGLGNLYPASHKSTAMAITQKGCLISEFRFWEKPEPAFFVKRNRIVAGMADATIVIESGLKGGALITADIASSYNRDVFAVPGNVSNIYSEGCNRLIKSNKAALLESVEDLEYLLGWDIKDVKQESRQMQLFTNLSDEEQLIMEQLKKNGDMPFDHIYLESNLPVSKVSALLLNLELLGIVKSLPGKVYRAV